MHLSRLAHALGTEICNSLPGYHAFTGCDTTSAFYGKGKKRSFEILIKDCTIQAGMAEQGVAPECSLDTKKVANCLFVDCMDNRTVHLLINEARYKIFCAKAPACQNLPSTADALSLHVKRTNYQAYIWKHALQAFPAVGSCNEDGWIVCGQEK